MEVPTGNAAARLEIEAANNKKRRAAFAFVETYSCHIYYILSLTDQFQPCPQSLVLEGEAEVGRLKLVEKRRSFRAGLGLAGMAVYGRFHRVPLVVPNILAAAGADERNMPDPLMNLHGIFIGEQPFPFVEDWQVAPRPQSHDGIQ